VFWFRQPIELPTTVDVEKVTVALRGTLMPTPEEQARETIDKLLEAVGWQVQDRSQLNLGVAPGVAVREFPLKTGFADYLLFVDRRAVGVIEAKPAGTTLSGVAEQSAAYLKIRQKDVRRWHGGDRPAVVRAYLDAGLRLYQPRCWKRHQDEGETLPLDWPHTLEALYRVRCNLFHGEKGLDSQMDALVVSSAFRVLVHFLHDSGYILARRNAPRRR
jgi:hypothetical protein